MAISSTSKTISGKTKTSSTNSTPYVYGQNVSGFDRNNPNQVALADAGQAWANAKAKGDTAGMAAAAAKGATLRSQNGVDEVYNSRQGVTSFTPAFNAANPAAPTQTDNLSGFKDSQTNLINDIYNNQRNSQLQKIKEQRDIQLQGLNKVGVQADQSAAAQRSQVAAADIQAAQRLREAMANGGVQNGGDNLTANSNLNTQRQDAMGQINQNLAQVQQDVTERQKLINDAAANQDLALLQQLQAQQSQDLLTLGYQVDDRNFRNNQFDWQKQIDTAGLTGNFGPQRTLQGQQFDSNQTQQQWQNRFDYGKSTGTFQNGQQTLEARQANIGNLWNVADATGTIPDQLADMYHIPRGTKTQAARQWTASYGLDQDQQNYNWSKLESDMLGGSGKYSGLTPSQAINSLQEKYGTRTAVPSGTLVDEMDANGYPTGRKVEGNKYVYQTTNDPAKREQMYMDIVSMQLESDSAEQQVMLGAGLTQKEIEAFDKKHLK